MAETLQSRTDLDWRFFDALGGHSDAVNLPSDPGDQIKRFGRPLAAGELGCFKSHYYILRAHAEANGWLLVLEDDVWLDPDFSLEETVALLERRGLQYCRLYAKCYRPANVIGEMSGFRQLVRFRTDPYGTQAYLIHSDGARRFVACQNAIVRPIDDELGRFWEHGLWPVAVFPFPAVERSVVSSIDDGREKGNLDRLSSSPSLLAHRFSEKIRKIVANVGAPR